MLFGFNFIISSVPAGAAGIAGYVAVTFSNKQNNFGNVINLQSGGNIENIYNYETWINVGNSTISFQL